LTGGSGTYISLPQFSVGRNDIEFVHKWPHLEHIITTMCDDKADIFGKQNVLWPN